VAAGFCRVRHVTFGRSVAASEPGLDQSVARKAQQEPEGEMEETETAAAAEALGYRSQPAIY
jgi:hypothetical protein